MAPTVQSPPAGILPAGSSRTAYRPGAEFRRNAPLGFTIAPVTGHPANAAEASPERAAIAGAGLVLALLVIALIGANGIFLIALLIVGPLYASTAAKAEHIAAVGAFAVVAGTIMGAMNDGISKADHAVALLAVVLGSILAMTLSRMRGITGEEHQVDVEEAASRARAHLASESRRVLASGREPIPMLVELTELAVPGVADLAIVDLLQPDGALAEVAVTAEDSALAADLREKPRYGYEADSDHPVVSSARSGEALQIPALTDELLYSLAGSPERFDLLVGAGATSAQVVPFVAHGESIGVMVLVRFGDRPAFDEVDLEIARDLAGRTALALDNARLAAEATRAPGEVETT
jgi:hypothetical protein